MKSAPALGLETRVEIPNHCSPVLSEMDLAMVRSIPPGGNWKNIPTTIPSRRLEQIRSSYAEGKGSRSTYYGRLNPDAPAYTISTYFNRPGNGCYIHYDQNRLISQREAARLQSFPDSFVFHGNQRSVNQQIGNAVPPLLAYLIAGQLGDSAQFIDLFSGAGGLSLGFVWAGWKPLVASDLDRTFLETYSHNVHSAVVPGDIRDDKVFDEVARVARSGADSKTRMFVLGGPPCQGFSTAGERRSISDQRNSFFTHYVQMLNVVKPDGFVFENVPGLLNMLQGEVLRIIRCQLEAEGFDVLVWKLRTEQYAIPQRRFRVLLIGTRPGTTPPLVPEPVTAPHGSQILLQRRPRCFSVREAIDDLPPLEAGQDGSALGYVSEPRNPYQKLVRGGMVAHDFIAKIRGDRL